MENKVYDVVILEISHIVLNIQDSKLYKKNGGNLIGALVIDADEILHLKKSTIKRNRNKIIDEFYYKIQVASLCFDDEQIKKIMKQYFPSLKYIEKEKNYFDLRGRNRISAGICGLTLTVEEKEALFYESKPRGYDIKNDIFNPKFYDPDDWEFVLKVQDWVD